MYYNDPACFGSQRVVDTIVEDIAHTVGVERVALNVVSVRTTLKAAADKPRKQLQRDWSQGGIL